MLYGYIFSSLYHLHCFFIKKKSCFVGGSSRSSAISLIFRRGCRIIQLVLDKMYCEMFLNTFFNLRCSLTLKIASPINSKENVKKLPACFFCKYERNKLLFYVMRFVLTRSSLFKYVGCVGNSEL